MSKPPLPEAAVAMLKKPNPAVVATVRSDGHPVSTATWYLWDDGRVLLNMDEGRKRLDHLRKDPRITLTVLDDGDWYTHVTLMGRVAEMHEDRDLTDIDRLSQHYLGQPYSQRDRGRVSAWIEIERWHGWGSFRDSDQASG
ncbi:PPOX class F420-dependent oxidoreductase [Streptomyces poonensis]|uniref:PPOX class F420-dependent enzyme n=1 Tax=Streptomyces poonensis TaxID=68255 RepID=A0A918PDV5_9ACTN|nr:PPOX class F420-dependent oxidoreductase [Streptomyces poonensis]GGY99726.1 PPOX class F420-dependent enzyme [Streptomyces poonensis]GLJ92206.1 PPOX class F420-dependent enzyme [Streptomyces poonensis]